MAKYWIFQDESGEPAKDAFFIVGILGMTANVKRRLLDKVRTIREIRNYSNELHFNKFSDLRAKVYKEVLDEAFGCYFTYRAIVVPKERVSIGLFDNKRHLAYNKFSELLIYHHIKERVEDIHIRPDDKSRMKEDNFYEYLVRNLNQRAFYEERKYSVKSCKSSTSKTCDAVQVCDLITGIVKNKYMPAGERKNEFAQYILSRYSDKINIWEWRPNKKF